MPPDPSVIYAIKNAVEARAWYPLASIVLTLLIALWKQLQPTVWDRIPERWQWVPAALAAAAAAFVDAAAHSLGFTVALSVALYALFAAAAPAIGLHHTQKSLRS